MSASGKFVPDPSWPTIIELAIELWGQPNKALSSRDEIRFGANGSKSVKPSAFVWKDHEANTGGGYLDIWKLARHGEPLPKKPKRANGHAGNVPPWQNIGQRYPYLDAAGRLVLEVIRTITGSPRFLQRRPDPSNQSGWKWSVKDIPVEQRPLYRLPELIASNAEFIFVCEGEKDCDNLAAKGLIATTNVGGAGKWRPEYGVHFTGRHVVILPDNDPPGRDHAATVAASLTGVAASVRVLMLPGLAVKGDVSDWLAAGGTAEELERLARDTPVYVPPPPREDATGPAKAAMDDMPDLITEGSVADAFTAAHRDQLRFDHTAGRWFLWDGTRWRREETRIAYRWAHEVARRLAADADNAKVTIVAEKAAFAGGVERLAQTARAFAVTHEIWDSDPWLLGTPGGVVDLRTGRTRPARPEDFITKLTAVGPADEANCPLWLRFLNETTGNDQMLIGFLRRWFGYCLTGITQEHALLFVHGDGGNGKGVAMNTVFGIMGDYAANAAMDSFVVTRGDKHTTDLAMLAGARMVMTSEVEEGQTWAEARIKALTGGDPITARFMRQDNFTYIPKFKLTISGNHKPALKTVDNSTRRRFNMVPFVRKPAKPDKTLSERLKAEWPGILRWMIDGCLEWQQFGLNPPEAVTEATTDYFEAQNYFGRWLDDCCILHKDLEVKPAILLHSFQDWCRENGEEMTDNKRLRGMLEKTPGVRYVKTDGVRGIRGIGLKPPPRKAEPSDD